MTMKIGSNSQTYANATFSFTDNGQQNPKVVKFTNQSQKKINELPYSQFHYWIDTDGVSPRTLEFSGWFFGANRLTALRNLSSEMHTVGIKRFWLDSDTFVMGSGFTLNTGIANTQVLFRPYQGVFGMVSPFMYDGTENSGVQSITADQAWTNLLQLSNSGNAPAHIMSIDVVNNTGGNVTEVRVSDATGGTGNVIAWKGNGANALSSGDTLSFYVLYAVSGSPGVVEKQYYLNNGSNSGTRNYTAVNNNDFVRIEAGAVNQQFSAYVNGNGGSGCQFTLKWHDAYWE